MPAWPHTARPCTARTERRHPRAPLHTYGGPIHTHECPRSSSAESKDDDPGVTSGLLSIFPTDEHRSVHVSPLFLPCHARDFMEHVYARGAVPPIRSHKRLRDEYILGGDEFDVVAL